LGYEVGKEVVDDNIHCLGNDFHTVVNGSTNCWAYWLEGQQVENHDVYLWLNTE